MLRACMNIELEKYKVSGKVLDVGGGKKPSYLEHLNTENMSERFVADMETGERVDLEKDNLPYDEETFSQVLMFNLLEHIYNHKHVLKESHRVLEENGTLLGFVPFFINYHPDPRDFFRYTGDALERLLKESGFEDISVREVGGGPFFVNCNNLMTFLPTAFRVLLFPLYFLLDLLVLKLRPSFRSRYPLGYIFQAKKKK